MLPLHLPAVSTDLQYGLYEQDACSAAAEALNPVPEHAEAVVAEDEEMDGNGASFA